MSLGTLIMLRHGESDWNAKNLFTGWVDVPLTDRGECEAARSGAPVRAAGLVPAGGPTSGVPRTAGPA